MKIFRFNYYDGLYWQKASMYAKSEKQARKKLSNTIPKFGVYMVEFAGVGQEPNVEINNIRITKKSIF